MKKSLKLIALAFLTAPLVFSIDAFAAATYDVLTVEASQASGVVSFSGTTETGVLAVSCSLNSKDGEELDFTSTAVSDDKFSGSFEIQEGDYDVKCANYDGGRIVVASVGEEEVDSKENSPETGAFTAESTASAVKVASFSGLALLALGIVLLILRKRRA
ncbi:hypothetical protein IJG21_03225 [Candidatus Saccharibacteria bacterium]|nr:hypothetical protein [Candidatus Saccharibacteria bacterium]